MPLNKTQCVKITLFPKEINHGVSCSYKTINEKMTNRINTEISLKCVGTNPLLSATVSDRLGNT